MGVPYVPVVGLVGTDLLKRRDDMIIAPNPFNPSVKSVVAKSLRPDVAVFHAQMADRFGNVSFGYDVEAVILAEASKHVVVTVERIVDNKIGEKEAKGAFMPSILVNDLVHAPYGAHPAGCVGFYGPDKIHMREYVVASRDDAAFAEYVKTHVHGVANHEEYVERFVPREWKDNMKVSGS